MLSDLTEVDSSETIQMTDLSLDWAFSERESLVVCIVISGIFSSHRFKGVLKIWGLNMWLDDHLCCYSMADDIKGESNSHMLQSLMGGLSPLYVCNALVPYFQHVKKGLSTQHHAAFV